MSTDQRVVALRGAITVEANSGPAIVAATAELVTELMTRNGVAHEDLISILFTSTPDLDAEFPAAAARGLGISQVPLLCAREIPVTGAMPGVVRVLMHLYSDHDYASLRHVYLGGARSLREDLAE
jgi:chorismate mutase